MIKQLLKTLLPKSLSSTLARLYRTYITRYISQTKPNNYFLKDLFNSMIKI